MEDPKHNSGDLMGVIFDPEVEKMFSHLAELFGVRAVLFDPSGNEVFSGSDKPICEFCDLIQNKLGQYKNCRAWDAKQQQLAADSQDLIAYQCHAGVNEAIMAVYDKDTLLGYVLIGQYRSREKPEEHLRTAWQRKHNTDEIDKAFERIPRHGPQEIEHIEALFASLVRLIASQRLIEVHERNPLQVLIARMRHNPAEQLSLQGAATILGKSPSTVSHLFTQYYHSGFKQVQLRIRMEKACQLLEDDPDLRILDIAEQLGFSDPLYFSRQFKQFVHLSPSEYRKSIKK